MSRRPGPRPIVDERRFMPPSIAAARALHDALVAAGTPRAQARGIVTWLITLPDRRAQDPATDSVRRDYRRELARLGSPPWQGNEAKGA